MATKKTLKKSMTQKEHETPIEEIKEKSLELREKSASFVTEFKNFALKGNVFDLAIGVIIGTGFSKIVDSLVKDVILPTLGLFTGTVDFSNWFFEFSGAHYTTAADAEAAGVSVVRYGQFLNALIQFFIIAFVIFIVVKKLAASRKKDEKKPEITTRQCPYCFTQIDKKAIRCPNCTSEVKPMVKVIKSK